MEFCLNLQVVPTNLNLASLKSLYMFGCCQLRKFPDIFRNITFLSITDTMLQELHEPIRLWSRLQSLQITSNRIRTFASIVVIDQLPIDLINNAWGKRASDIKDVDLDIEKLPYWIKYLHGLEALQIFGCQALALLPELPALLKRLMVYNCESLETLMPFPSESAIKDLNFTNCFKLDQESRRVITQQFTYACLPGKNVRVESNYRTIGNSLIIPSGTKELRYWIVVSPKQGMKGPADLLVRLSYNGFPSEEGTVLQGIATYVTEHLFIRHLILPENLESELLMEFSPTSKDLDVIECGFQIFTDKTNSSYKFVSEQVSENDDKSLSDEIIEFDEPIV